VTRLPGISGKKLIGALKRLGFAIIRVKGSHHYLRHPDGRPPWFRFMPVRPSGAVCSRKFSGTQNSMEKH
jgi:predicted RNA binding protein YcfA (HicA-like mRNA interferase family)